MFDRDFVKFHEIMWLLQQSVELTEIEIQVGNERAAYLGASMPQSWDYVDLLES